MALTRKNLKGYGEVFKGVWLGQDVAIKVYKKKQKKEKKFGEDFLKEVEVIFNIRHPNIVLFMGVSIFESKGLLITEYIIFYMRLEYKIMH